jgi:hypothetical protein
VREFTLGTVRTDIEESFENWVEDEISVEESRIMISN